MAAIFQDGSSHLYDSLIWVISVSNQSFFMMQNSNLEIWNWPKASFYLTAQATVYTVQYGITVSLKMAAIGQNLNYNCKKIELLSILLELHFDPINLTIPISATNEPFDEWKCNKTRSLRPFVPLTSRVCVRFLTIL